MGEPPALDASVAGARRGRATERSDRAAARARLQGARARQSSQSSRRATCAALLERAGGNVSRGRARRADGSLAPARAAAAPPPQVAGSLRRELVAELRRGRAGGRDRSIAAARELAHPREEALVVCLVPRDDGGELGPRRVRATNARASRRRAGSPTRRAARAVGRASAHVNSAAAAAGYAWVHAASSCEASRVPSRPRAERLRSAAGRRVCRCCIGLRSARTGHRRVARGSAATTGAGRARPPRRPRARHRVAPRERESRARRATATATTTASAASPSPRLDAARAQPARRREARAPLARRARARGRARAAGTVEAVNVRTPPFACANTSSMSSSASSLPRAGGAAGAGRAQPAQPVAQRGAWIDSAARAERGGQRGDELARVRVAVAPLSSACSARRSRARRGGSPASSSSRGPPRTARAARPPHAGLQPVTIMCSVQPSVNRSVRRSISPASICSGDMKVGVPLCVPWRRSTRSGRERDAEVGRA